MMNTVTRTEEIDVDNKDKVADTIRNIFPNYPDFTRGMVIAIQQPHSRAILDGTKEIEFRRTHLNKENAPDIGLIYEPSPTQSIIGAFTIGQIEQHSVSELWTLAKRFSPSKKKSFFDYFRGKESGTAIFVEEAVEFESPIELHSDNGSKWVFTPPQNFYYVNLDDFFRDISKHQI